MKKMEGFMTEYFNEMKREAGFDTKINEDTSLP